MTESHQETPVALSSLIEGYRIFPTGARRGMLRRKVNVKTLKATEFKKMLGVRIMLKLKKLGAKIL